MSDFWKHFGEAMDQIFGSPVPATAPAPKPVLISADARAFAEQLNLYLASRSTRIRGALTRPDMDPRGEPVAGWSRSVETMPVPKNSVLGQVLMQCLTNEEHYTRFTNSIFCGWTVKSEGPAVWQFQQTVYFKVPEKPLWFGNNPPMDEPPSPV
jgi:hypothetical protein